MYRTAYQDCVQIQQVLKEDAVNPDADRRERAYAALAWERLEERKRILRNRPLPKSIDVTKLPKRGRAKAQAAEPSEPKPS